MSIESVKIKEFTIFNDVDINFASGINVIIGENGTGKTHLIKLLYARMNTDIELKSYFTPNSMMQKWKRSLRMITLNESTGSKVHLIDNIKISYHKIDDIRGNHDNEVAGCRVKLKLEHI